MKQTLKLFAILTFCLVAIGSVFLPSLSVYRIPVAHAQLLAQATPADNTGDTAAEDATAGDTNRAFINCGNQDTINEETQTQYTQFNYTSSDSNKRPCTLKDIFYLGIRGVNILVSFAGIFAVFMIILAGLRFVAAGGNPTGIKDAKSGMASAVIGLALVLLAFVIINTIFKGSFSLGLKEGANVLSHPFDYIRGYAPGQAPPAGGSTSTTPPGPADNTPAGPPDAGLPPGIKPWTAADPYGFDWGSKPELKKAFDDFNAAWQAQGGNALKARQAFRPPDYTAHIRSIFEAYRLVKGDAAAAAKGYNCTNAPLYVTAAQAAAYTADQKTYVNAEAKKHGFTTGDTPPACQSDHEKGIAIDITPPAVSGATYQKWMEVGEAAGLCHNIAGDEPHFGLKKYLSGSPNCRQP